MIIKKDTPVIFLRIPNFERKYNIIDEHIKVLEKNGYVDLMKLGKRPNELRVTDLFKLKGYLILKSASKFGNKFYLCTVEKINEQKKYCYPEYYNNIFYNMNSSLDKMKEEAFWIRITNMKEVESTIIDNFKTYSKKTSIYDSAMSLYQVSTMYGFAEKEMKI